MSRFLNKEFLKVLKFLSKYGHYKNRIHISKHVAQLSIKAQIEILDILIDDAIPIVSINAIGFGKVLLQSNYIRQKATEKEIYWEKRKAELSKKQKSMAEILKGSKNYKRKFSDGGTLANMKNMLKKPMNTGKWF
ncbi:hypothetical protein [Rasiella sp. SM2506]|uniref:hypothetical protein n=1 Tax=Rasiella sp. SM2506 TaxID=3423914 RepID=UPI003D7905AB